MNLYLITATAPISYDVWHGAVVVAKTKGEAMKIHPNGQHTWIKGKWRDKDGQIKGWDMDWVPRAKVEVEFLGPAKHKAKAGVVLGSFTAG